MPELNPTVGDLGDLTPEQLEEKLGPKGTVHLLNVTSYDAIATWPVMDENGDDVLDDDGEVKLARHKYVDTFHVICDIRVEKVVVALNKMTKHRDPETGKMVVDDRAQAEAGARMIVGVVIPSERQEFLDLLDDPDRAFADDWFDVTAQWVLATFEEEAGRPLELPGGSSNGNGKHAQTRRVEHDGRVSHSELSPSPST